MTFFTKEKITEIKIIATLFVVGACAFLLIYGIIMTTKAKQELLDYEFSGVVNKITYCEKGISYSQDHHRNYIRTGLKRLINNFLYPFGVLLIIYIIFVPVKV